MKKTLTLLLALILVVSLVGCNVAPADNTTSDTQNGVLQGDSQNNKTDTQNDVSADTGKTQTSDNQTDNQSGESADISRDEAIQIALDHAKVNKADAQKLTAEKDSDDNPVHYDVDFYADGYEYDYEIAAATGKILKSEKERDDDGNPSSSSSATLSITKETAKKTALDHAKVAEKDAKRLEIELDDDGYYEVSFDAGGYEYDYKISAKTGKILKSEKEKDDDAQQTSSNNTVSDNDSSGITKAKAKQIALEHAKVAEKDAKRLEIELDDDGYYEVSFTSGGYEYDYKISAKTGKILKSEKEKDDDAKQTAAPATVSKADAKATALKHAGVSSANARDLEVELDDDGYYEVTFEAGGYEYEYKISAKTGKIIHSEKERND